MNDTSMFAQSTPAKAENQPSASEPGLRERQKLARGERILAAAAELFNSLGFEDTTMAAIARGAEVSTPTVFNYFRTKDELLLALVLQVHQQTRERVSAFEPPVSADAVNAVGKFLEMYTRQSLQSISRNTWRHVEATRIRMPESGFVKSYDALSDEMLIDFQRFLSQLSDDAPGANRRQLNTLAVVLFDHWSALFIELIRDDNAEIDAHTEQLRAGVSLVLNLVQKQA